jgi:hypothetical protein
MATRRGATQVRLIRGFASTTLAAQRFLGGACRLGRAALTGGDCGPGPWNWADISVAAIMFLFCSSRQIIVLRVAVSSRESRKCFVSVAAIRCGRRQSSSCGAASAASGRGILTGLIAPVVKPACHRKTMRPLFRRRQPCSGFGWRSANTAACPPGCTHESCPALASEITQTARFFDPSEPVHALSRLIGLSGPKMGGCCLRRRGRLRRKSGQQSPQRSQHRGTPPRRTRASAWNPPLFSSHCPHQGPACTSGALTVDDT